MMVLCCVIVCIFIVRVMVRMVGKFLGMVVIDRLIMVMNILVKL